MFSSWKLGTAFGIGIYVHWSFLLLPAWVFLSNLGLDGGLMALYSVGLVMAVFGCVVLHELGHAMAARRFGITTRDITLYPIGGVARLERMSDRPWEECFIAVAGPLINVVIAALLGAFLLASDLVTELFPLPSVGMMFLFHLMAINIWLVVFNLIPAFPMDGGRVLRALLALRLGRLRATEVAVSIGMVLAVVLALAGLVGPEFLRNPFLVVIAAFVYLAGQQELAAVRYSAMSGRHQDAAFQREDAPFPGRGYTSQPAGGFRPNPRVYLWDERTQQWIEQRPLRPVHE
jgi:Zn-dependent protease